VSPLESGSCAERICRDVSNFSLTSENSFTTFCDLLRKNGAGDEARTRNFQLGNLNFPILYFQYLQNRSEKMYVHALHTVHAVPDLRVAGGRLGDGVSVNFT
jgi:hypothetical protein